ncbi:MAG: hypothetical protein ACRDPK_00525 [Carbonactinosporaceae bacterium]
MNARFRCPTCGQTTGPYRRKHAARDAARTHTCPPTNLEPNGGRA